MKKQLFSILAVTTALVLGLTSCAKEDTASNLEVDLSRTATIQGKILVNTDETAVNPRWSAPSTVSLIATVPYSSLNAQASGTYVIPKENISYESSTGIFTIKAPVSVQGTVVTVKFEDFKGEVRQPDGTGTKTVKVIWKSQTRASVTVYPGETYNLTYWQLNGFGYIKDTNSGDDI